ncbi:hypothetical protein [Variovorax paradoxus]|uniref:hypothetical protein n=1 Tax=Variovorax paradoxus TaxID=34073 RepID=UPI001E48CAF4
MAVACGHFESTCVRDRGWQGMLDRDLMEKVLAEDFALVTNNAVDFRGAVRATSAAFIRRRRSTAALSVSTPKLAWTSTRSAHCSRPRSTSSSGRHSTS